MVSHRYGQTSRRAIAENGRHCALHYEFALYPKGEVRCQKRGPNMDLERILSDAHKKLRLVERVPFWLIMAKASQKLDTKKLHCLMSGTPSTLTKCHGMVLHPLTECSMQE